MGMAVFWITGLPILRKNVLPASNCIIPWVSHLVENINERHPMVMNIHTVKRRENYITI
jgi:hypothetical protein